MVLTRVSLAQNLDNIGLAMKSVYEQNSFVLYLEIELDANSSRLYNYEFDFRSQSGLVERPLEYQDSIYQGSKKDQHYFKYIFNDAEVGEEIKVILVNKSDGLTFTYTHSKDETHPVLLFDKKGLPILNYWTNPGDFLLSADSVFGFYYATDFGVALPPMTTKETAPATQIQIDSSFIVNKKIELKKPGLYLFQKDTSEMKAIAIRVEPFYFPRFTTIEELVGPLIYLSDIEEQDQLEKIGNDKKLFDKFWLKMAENPERAKKIIRGYYDRVEYVNSNFTTFKEGWKTDMGMIYLVMGPPHSIEKSGNKEVWNYQDGRHLPKRRYQFIKTSTLFSPAHYVLIRERKHAESWFKAVNLIRNGIF